MQGGYRASVDLAPSHRKSGSGTLISLMSRMSLDMKSHSRDWMGLRRPATLVDQHLVVPGPRRLLMSEAGGPPASEGKEGKSVTFHAGNPLSPMADATVPADPMGGDKEPSSGCGHIAVYAGSHEMINLRMSNKAKPLHLYLAVPDVLEARLAYLPPMRYTQVNIAYPWDQHGQKTFVAWMSSQLTFFSFSSAASLNKHFDRSHGQCHDCFCLCCRRTRPSSRYPRCCPRSFRHLQGAVSPLSILS